MQKFLCNIAGFLSNLKLPAFFIKIIALIYSRIFNIQLELYELNWNEIKSFNDFFTRKFKEGKRIFFGKISAPVDASIYASGKVENNEILQIKNQKIKINDLICAESHDFKGYYSFYLSPADYHRVHAPTNLCINEIFYVPGYYYSVRPAVAKKKDVFIKNERLIINCNSEFGKISLILVAAQNVGDLRVSATGNNTIKSKEITKLEITHQKTFRQGEELAYFKMGSAVVMLVEQEQKNKPEIRKIYLGDALV